MGMIHLPDVSDLSAANINTYIQPTGYSCEQDIFTHASLLYD